ncbi:hypothetical protein EK21DRAFT_104144 [Setomelanomma holmii]|uniref:MARVEL domain-containing protein n=1 Tax=Setomelanomma holmii TaxID=210430 RepID=A0A9P4LIK1_9PLEO|nr:hypothetical protein EK21DRAFT_104144 [Setomelanomma holmii]
MSTVPPKPSEDVVHMSTGYTRPGMPPPPYFKTHFVNPNSFKAAINTKLDNPVVSLFRLSLRLLQFAFVLASGISYAVELAHDNVTGHSSFIYAQVVLGFTMITLITDSVTIRCYRFTRLAYLNGTIEPEFRGADVGRMQRAVWCDLVNALLWFGSASFSSAMCCTGAKAAIKNKLQRKRQKKDEKGTMLRRIEDMETGVVGTEITQGDALHQRTRNL